MGIVLANAEKALEQGELPIAAAIFHNDEIIAQHYTTEKKEKKLLVHAELKTLLEIDALDYTAKERKGFQLFTNLEPCMMCFGAVVSSFIGEIYYSLDSPSDGAVKWALETWNDYHVTSGFKLPEIVSGVLEAESRKLFMKYIDIHKSGAYVDWVKTLV